MFVGVVVLHYQHSGTTLTSILCPPKQAMYHIDIVTDCNSKAKEVCDWINNEQINIK